MVKYSPKTINSNWNNVDIPSAAARANETYGITLRSLGPDTYCDPCGCSPPTPGGGEGEGGEGGGSDLGACCIDGICSDGFTIFTCAVSGGEWQGDGSVCSQVTCQQKTGACCSSGICTEVTEESCTGIYHGDDSRCVDIDCSFPDATGACCSPDGTCTETTRVACEQAGGAYQGDNEQCSNVNCIPEEDPVGACCLIVGGKLICTEATEALCASNGGVYRGDGVICGTGTCNDGGDPVGACCIGDLCSELTLTECVLQGGIYRGDGELCENTLCNDNPTNALFFFTSLTEHDGTFPPQRLTSPTLTAPDGIGVGKSIFYTPGTYSGDPLPAISFEWLRNGEVFDPELPVTHVVEITEDNTFIPSSITVKPGDTVKWELLGGFHGVRSGVGEDGCGDGVVFESHAAGAGTDTTGTLEDSDGNPFEWNVPSDFDPQTLEYRCSIHCGSMIGTIEVEKADMSYVIQESDTGSTFKILESASNIVGVEESESSPLTVVSDEDYPLIGEGNGFVGVTTHDEYVGDVDAKGREARAIVRWTELPFIVRDEVFYCTVSAYHMEGINRIEFILDDGTPVAVEERKAHPTDIHPASHTVNIYEGTNRYNGYHEYMVKVDPAELSDGLHEMRCVAYPNHGKPFCLQGEIDRSDLPGVELLSDCHWSFWFTVQHNRDVRTVGSGDGADYDTLADLFGDVPTSFLTGGKIILEAGDEHEWPTVNTSADAKMQIGNDVSYKTYGETFPDNDEIRDSYGLRVGTPLSIVAESGNPAFASRIAPRFKDKAGYGFATSIHYHGLVFTQLSAHSALQSCAEVGPPCFDVASSDDLDFINKSNLTGLSQRSESQGNNASLLMESCTIKGDRASTWTSFDLGDDLVTGQTQRLANNGGFGGKFYKGMFTVLVPAFAGSWTPLVKNCYSLRGIADWSANGIACVINHLFVAMGSNGSIAEPLFIHSDIYQYTQTGGQSSDTHTIDLFDVTAQLSNDRTIEFLCNSRNNPTFGSGVNQDPGLPSYDGGINHAGFDFASPKDVFRFRHISHSSVNPPIGANTNAKFDIFLHCGDPSIVGDDYCNCDPYIAAGEEELDERPTSKDCIYLGRLQNDADGIRDTYPFMGAQFDFKNRGNRYMDKFTSFIAREVPSSDSDIAGSGCSTSIVGYGIDYRSAPDNRIFAAVHGWTPHYQIANISYNFTDQFRDFRLTNWAYEGWRLTNSEFTPTPDWNHWQHYNHVVFDNNIIIGPRLVTSLNNTRGIVVDDDGNRSWNENPDTDGRWKHVKWGSEQIWSVGRAAKFEGFIPDVENPPSVNQDDRWFPTCFIDHDTSIMEPFHVEEGGLGGDPDYPYADCTSGVVRYQRYLPSVGLSSNEWNELIQNEEAYPEGDEKSLDPRVETYVNPELVTDADGTHWNHSEIISGWEQSFSGNRIDVLEANSLDVQGALIGVPFFAPAQGECRCGCVRIAKGDDTQYFPWEGIEMSYNADDRPGGSGAAKSTRFMCPHKDDMPIYVKIRQAQGRWDEASQPVPMDWGSCICASTGAGCSSQDVCAKLPQCRECNVVGPDTGETGEWDIRCKWGSPGTPGGVSDLCCNDPLSSAWCGTAESTGQQTLPRLTGCGMPYYFFKWQDVDLSQPELNIVDPCKYFTNDVCPDDGDG